MQAPRECLGSVPTELLLLPELAPGAHGPRRQAWLASFALHGVLVGTLLVLPPTRSTLSRGPQILFERPTQLVAPPQQLTQRAPNQGKVGSEFDLESLLPRRPLRLPPGAFRPPESRARAETGPGLPEPPQLAGAGVLAQAPPLPIPAPQIQPVEKPKLAFEPPGPPPAVAPGTGQVPVPSTSVSEAARAALRGRGGGLVVGDADLAQMGYGDAWLLPAAGRQGSALELLSDPMGVDFKPYLIQILATVRRNWYAVMPEVARLGRQGKVVIQFAIQRDGSVPKLVIVMPSGTEALDRAAVAGISASNPFPPLPAGYRGLQVRLQFTFLYNMPR